MTSNKATKISRFTTKYFGMDFKHETYLFWLWMIDSDGNSIFVLLFTYPHSDSLIRDHPIDSIVRLSLWYP